MLSSYKAADNDANACYHAALNQILMLSVDKVLYQRRYYFASRAAARRTAALAVGRCGGVSG